MKREVEFDWKQNAREAKKKSFVKRNERVPSTFGGNCICHDLACRNGIVAFAFFMFELCLGKGRGDILNISSAKLKFGKNNANAR